MITFERYGVREDGNPVIETSTYIPVPEDHPLAVEVEGHEGFWARIAVGNSLPLVRAVPVTRTEFNQAESSMRELAETRRLEAQAQRERIQAELEAKKTEIRRELRDLGLSQETITAILKQVRE